MKKLIFLICFLMVAVTSFSQRQTQYNIKGDEAMQNLNYRDAAIWYEEGVADCNMYSISQLTKIWLADDSLRVSTNYVMSRCLDCLNDRAKETKDTASIKQLILYYTEGIGTTKNDRQADFWKAQLESISNPYTERIPILDKPLKEKTKIEFFVGYSASMLAPVGLEVGLLGKSVGGYLRYRTNLSFKKHTEVCNERGVVEGLSGSAYAPTDDKNINAMIATGGLIFRTSNKFLISMGAGYWKRDLLYEFEKTNLTVTAPEGSFWAKCEERSYKGIAVDIDGTYRIGKIFYVSAGCNALNFKYIYGNLGIGVIF